MDSIFFVIVCSEKKSKCYILALLDSASRANIVVRASAVRRHPSVKDAFSETVEQINATFGVIGSYPPHLQTIIVCFSKFLIPEF